MKGFALALIIAASLAAGFVFRGVLPAEQRTVATAQRTYQAPSPLAPVTYGSESTEPEVENARSPAFSTLFDQPTIFDTLYQAYRLAAEADIPTLERYALQAIAIDDPLFRLNIADIFVEKMNALDVNAALDFVEALPDPANRRRLLTSVLATWIRKDPEAALAYLESITDERLRLIAARVIGRDNSLPAEVLLKARSVASATPDGARSQNENPYAKWERAREQVMRAMQIAPEQTIEDLLSKPPMDEGDAILSEAIDILARMNPEQALDYLQRYPKRLNPLAEVFLETVAGMRPDLAREQVEDFTLRTGQGGPMSAMLAAWMREDPELAESYLQTVPEWVRPEVAQLLGSKLIRENSRAGLEWVLENSASGYAMVEMAIVHAGPDAVAVVESTLIDLPQGEKRTNMLKAVARNKGETDPEQALAWLQEYREDEGYDQAYAAILDSWTSRDPDAAAAQILRQPVRNDTSHTYSRIAYRLARRDLNAARDWAAELEGDARIQATTSVVEAMARRDPQSARELVLSMPEGQSRDKVGAQLASALAYGDQWPEVARELGVSEAYIESYMMVIGR